MTQIDTPIQDLIFGMAMLIAGIMGLRALNKAGPSGAPAPTTT